VKTGSAGYALDLTTPVRFVATELEKAGPAGPAPTVQAMTAAYRHLPGDLNRVMIHEGAASEYDARRWLIRRALAELGDQVAEDGDGWRLAVPFEALRFRGRKLYRTVAEDADDEQRAIRAAYRGLADERAFGVTVVGGRGATRQAQLTLHPLARAIPQMTEDEFAELAADVKAHGVKVPVEVMGSQVIDGRHRVAVAEALRVPVRLRDFEGTEDEARHHIVSMNVRRRHLNTAQRGLIVIEVFLPEAEAEAEARREAGRVRGGQEHALPPTGGRASRGKTAAEDAADRSMGLANTRTVERMTPVRDAPRTKERIRRGEIPTASQARREALAETGAAGSEPADVPATQPMSAYRLLGMALGKVRSAEDAIRRGDLGKARAGSSDQVTDGDLLARVGEIRQALDGLEKLLDRDEGHGTAQASADV